jgi:hypothetical protein
MRACGKNQTLTNGLRNMLEDLRAALRYDADTGRFFWFHRRGNVPAGTETGLCNNGKGYRVIGWCNRIHVAHRMAWAIYYGEWPAQDIDHINGDRADNRICNLRLATRGENMQNAKTPVHNSSGHRGVHWHAGAKKWRAVIWKDKSPHHLGFFDDITDAAEAYRAAKLRLHSFNPEVVARAIA